MAVPSEPRKRRRAGVRAVPVLLCLLTTACSAGSDRKEAPSGVALAQMVSDCSPIHLAPPTAAIVSACLHSDFSTVEVVNVSSAVLLIEAPDAFSVTVTPPQPERPGRPSLSESATADMMSANDAPGRNTEYLVPRAKAKAYLAGGPDRVLIGVDTALTTQKYGAEAAARWVERQLTPNNMRYTKPVAECAQEVGAFWQQRAAAKPGSPPPSIELVLIEAMTQYGKCAPLVKEVTEQLGRSAPPPPATLADELKSIGKDLKSTAYDDLLKLAKRALAAI